MLMGRGKKPNPRNQPASKADVERARIDGVHSGLALAIYAAVKRLEARNVEEKDVQRYAADVMDVCDSILKGYLKFSDVENALREEYGIQIVLR